MRAVKVLVNAEVGERQRQRILASASFAEVVFPTSPEDELREVREADVVFGRITPQLFEHAPMLRWVQALGAGVDGSLFDELVESPVVLTSEKGHVGPHLAEQAFALLLALTRGVARSIREQTWSNKSEIRAECWELTDRTIGIVGLGGTGLEVAKRAAAFGMRVVAVDPEDVVTPPYVTHLWTLDRLPRLLAEADAVVICAPLTDQTRGMFDRAAFERMQRHAILVNVTRGGIVDEDALIAALRDRLIAGAGLDVTATEPLPDGHPLWTMPNVVVTPHVAGASPRRLDRATSLFCENLQRYKAGQELRSLIDKRKGY
jgi:phosphoglycerate dehydrogenase-like enzyme